MRATCRNHVLALVGALAVICLAGPGCETQNALVPNTPPANGLNASRAVPPAAANAASGKRATRSDVVMLAPRPIPDEPAAPAEARGGDRSQVVWRASPRGLHASDDDDGGAVVPMSWSGGSCKQGDCDVARQNDFPKELNKVTMPAYRIEPPDILLINAMRVIPRPPYKIKPLDELVLQAPEKLLPPNEPISGVYPVQPDGQVDLGFSYGKVKVMGLTPEQARDAISKHVADVHAIKAPPVVVGLSQTRGFQQVRGEHLVRPDGTLSLGIYGDVYVAGMTLPEAKQAIEAQMSRMLLNPEVTVDVLGYNSKVYYVIYDGGGYGQQIYKLPIVGNETVLDAISELKGLPYNSSTKRIWVARPVPGNVGCRQVLPVDWAAITEGGATNTNYQVFPGDRIYVKANCWVAFQNKINKFVSPFERMLGFTLLGNATIRAVDGQQNGTGIGF